MFYPRLSAFQAFSRIPNDRKLNLLLSGAVESFCGSLFGRFCVLWKNLVESLSRINRTSIENLSKIYRTSIEHLSKINRTSIEHLSNIYRKSIVFGSIWWIWCGSEVDLGSIWRYLGGISALVHTSGVDLWVAGMDLGWI